MIFAVLRMLRLVFPIVVIYCSLLGVAIYLNSYFDYLTSYVDSRLVGDWMKRWSQLYVLVMFGAGIWMAAVWSALYGKKIPVRLAVATLTIASFTTVVSAVYTLSSKNSTSFLRTFDFLAAGGAFFAMCVLPLLAMRWLLAWQVLDEEDGDEFQACGRYTVMNIIWLTTAAAVCCAIVVWAFDFVGVEGNRGMEIIGATILFNVGGLLLLAAMSRFRIRFVWPIALLIAGTMALLSYAGSQIISRENALRNVFLPAFVGYSYALLLVLFAASWLRSQGILVRCGGVAGFGARREVIRRIPRRFIAGMTTCFVLATTSVGGWYYYPHWILIKSPIPTQPTIDDLPRLMFVAGHNASRFYNKEKRDAIFQRRLAAQKAIVNVGEEAIPFLLEQLTASGRSDESDGQNVRTACRLLSRIGREFGYGQYQDQVIETIVRGDVDAFRTCGGVLANAGTGAIPATIGVLETHDDRVTTAAHVLATIGHPTAKSAVPALERACRAEYPDGSKVYFSLFRSFAKLAGPDALPTLFQALEDHDKYDLQSGVSAAKAICEEGSKGATALPKLADLLIEVGSTNAPKARERQQITIIDCLAGIGPSASSLAPRLIEILAANPPRGKSALRAGGLQATTIRALGKLRAPEAVRELELLVQQATRNYENEDFQYHYTDNNIQMLALVALGEIGPAAKEAVDTIEAALRSHTAPLDGRIVVAAIVAKARIRIGQRESMIYSYVSKLTRGAHETSAVERGDVERTHTQAILCALIWLGAGEDMQRVMQHRASPSLDEDPRGLGNHFSIDPAEEKLPNLAALRAALLGSDSAAAFDDRWTIDGKVLSLVTALKIAIEAEDSTTRLKAAEILAAMGTLSRPSARTW